MAEPTKDDLLQQAEDLGLDVSDDPNKSELQERLHEHAGRMTALGPVEPHGEEESPSFEQRGSNKGVQPLTDDDLPDALR